MFTKKTNLLGEGNFSKVYLATGPDGLDNYAWKELKPGASANDAERFEREIQILSTLEHDRIVSVLFAKTNCSPPYFIMPKANMNLATAVKYDVQNKLDTPKVFKELCEAVIYAHSNGVLHRDIKPENILLFRDFSVKLSDFGLARNSDASASGLTKTNDTGGTLLYAAPEQYNSSLKGVDERVDVYSVGKVLYFLYTKESPHHMDLSHEKLPISIRYIVEKAAHPDLNKRFASIAILLRRFLEATGANDLTGSPDQKLKYLITQRQAQSANKSRLSEEIGELFLSQSENSVFFLKNFPNISSKIWLSLGETNWELFKSVFAVYDNWAAGSLPFDYTDKVADLYKILLTRFSDREFTVKAIGRLCKMGHIHNRYYVRNVVTQIMTSLDLSIGVEQGLNDFISDNRSAAEWTFKDVTRRPSSLASA